jgi:CubicO group peptidase (beta-lactamase class C family)
LLASTAAAQEPRAITPAALDSMAERHFGMAREAGGAAVVTVVKDGQVVFAKGFGLANPKTGAPVDPASTLFRIGSVSKLFTTLATLRLVERGTIDTTADVNRYLAAVGIRIQDDFPEPVTMKDLLDLRAGRFDWTYSYYYPIHDDSASAMPPDEVSRRLWRTARPHDVQAYDNNGLGLIGSVAAAAAGKSLRDLIRTEVLEPLGMAHSVMGVPRDRVPEMVGCHDPDPASAYRSCPYADITQNLQASGAMTVTGEDMGRLLAALLDGGRLGETRLLSPTAWARFVDFDANRMDPRLPAWGQVIYESLADGRYAFGHDGGIGRFTATVRVYPAARAGIFVAVQSGLDWEHPTEFPKALSDYFGRPAPQPPSAAMAALGTGRAGFESEFARTFIPAGGLPSAESAPPTRIPSGAIAGRYWTQHAQRKRPLLLRLAERFEPVTTVTTAGTDHLRIALPGAAPKEFEPAEVNAYREAGGGRTIVFAQSPRGINANWTDGVALTFLRRLPWHYRPAATIYPFPLALLVLLVVGVAAASGKSAGRTRALAIAGVFLVAIGVWAELELAVSQLYHGGHTGLAMLWRSALHLGLILTAVAAISLLRAGAGGGLRRLGGAVAVVAAAVVIGLTSYWGLLGRFTG